MRESSVRRGRSSTAMTASTATSATTATTACAIGVAAAVLALLGSWIPSLWGDEVTTSMSARRSWASLAGMLLHVDAVHGTYYALMHVWTALAGESPFALRLPSALAVGVAAAGVVVLVRVGGRSLTAAVVAGAVTAVLPRMTYAGEEARSYAGTAAIAVWLFVATLSTLRGTLRPRRGWTIVGVLLVVGTWLFLYTLLLVPVVALLVVATRGARARLRPWAITTAAALVVASPVVVAGYLERAQIAFLADRVTTDPTSLLVGVWFQDTAFAVVGWALVAVGLVGAAVDGMRRRRNEPGAVARGSSPSLEVLALAWAVVPPLVLILATPVIHGFSARYMTFTAPAAAILIAGGIVRIGRVEVMWRTVRSRGGRVLVPVGAVLAAAAVVAVATTTWSAQRTPYAKNGSDWAAVAAVVGEHARPGDDVAFDETAQLSRRPRLAMRGYPRAFIGLRDVTLVTAFPDAPTWHDEALTIDAAVAAHRFTAPTVWVVQYDADASRGREGTAALRSAGYRVVRSWPLHTDTVVEFRLP